MKLWRKMSLLAASALVASAVVIGGSASAQVAAGVKFENDLGANVSCQLPTPPSTVGATNVLAPANCSVYGTAGGDQVGPLGPKNWCFEGVAINATPVGASAGLFGCRVTVTGQVTGVTTATRTSESQVTYTCAGAGIGTAYYNPAPGSRSSRNLTGTVVIKLSQNTFTADGAMAFVSGTPSGGSINAVGVDGCTGGGGGSRAASPQHFAGTIN